LEIKLITQEDIKADEADLNEIINSICQNSTNIQLIGLIILF